MLFFFYK